MFSSVICLFGGNVAGIVACRSWANANDRLPRASLGRFEGGDASARVETLPMFVPGRLSRTRRTISISWARSHKTTKSTIKPSAGRASVGDGHQHSSGSNQQAMATPSAKAPASADVTIVFIMVHFLGLGP
jgi:hypothetical protein